MSKQIVVKYFQESEFAKEPCQATEGSAGYDLYAAETKTFLPNSADTVSIELRWAIPSGFFGKIFPRSSILKDHLVTVDAGVIDSDFRGIVEALLVNHSKKTYTVRTGDRIAQVVFIEKFDVNFQKVTKKSLLGITKRGSGSFGSTGLIVIKKTKRDSLSDKEESDKEEQKIFDEAITKVDNKVVVTKFDASLGDKPELLQIVKKPEDDLQILSEEAIMKVDNEVIVNEKITID